MSTSTVSETPGAPLGDETTAVRTSTRNRIPKKRRFDEIQEGQLVTTPTPATDFPTFAAQTVMDAEAAAAAAKGKEQRIRSLMEFVKEQFDEKQETERRVLAREAESKRQALALEAESAFELK